jgi:hypothetical protein
MALEMGGASGTGPAFLLGAGIVYEIVASACSSPQTTELNPHRGPTLMKWVGLGLAQGAVFVVLAAMWDRGNARPILAGGALAGVLMYGSYRHARASADASKAGTEPSAAAGYGWGNPT